MEGPARRFQALAYGFDVDLCQGGTAQVKRDELGPKNISQPSHVPDIPGMRRGINLSADAVADCWLRQLNRLAGWHSLRWWDESL